MTIIMCGQRDVLGDECPGCGGWLHRVRRGGFQADPNGMAFCDEDCIADDQERRARNHLDQHFGTRDLLCDCAEVCAPAGLPTEVERAEYAAYLASMPAELRP